MEWNAAALRCWYQWCFFQSKDKGPNESVVSRWNVNEEIRGRTIRNTEEMPVCVCTSNGRTTFFSVRDLQQFTRVYFFSDLCKLLPFLIEIGDTSEGERWIFRLISLKKRSIYYKAKLVHTMTPEIQNQIVCNWDCALISRISCTSSLIKKIR